MDDIRVAIGSRFGDGDEPIVQAIRDFTIRKYLERGYHVISADTNLPERVVTNLRKIAEGVAVIKDIEVPVEIEDFRHVSLETCLARNTVRHTYGDVKVPHEAIESMHKRFIKT